MTQIKICLFLTCLVWLSSCGVTTGTNQTKIILNDDNEHFYLLIVKDVESSSINSNSIVFDSNIVVIENVDLNDDVSFFERNGSEINGEKNSRSICYVRTTKNNSINIGYLMRENGISLKPEVNNDVIYYDLIYILAQSDCIKENSKTSKLEIDNLIFKALVNQYSLN